MCSSEERNPESQLERHLSCDLFTGPTSQKPHEENEEVRTSRFAQQIDDSSSQPAAEPINKVLQLSNEAKKSGENKNCTEHEILIIQSNLTGYSGCRHNVRNDGARRRGRIQVHVEIQARSKDRCRRRGQEGANVW